MLMCLVTSVVNASQTSESNSLQGIGQDIRTHICDVGRQMELATTFQYHFTRATIYPYSFCSPLADSMMEISKLLRSRAQYSTQNGRMLLSFFENILQIIDHKDIKWRLPLLHVVHEGEISISQALMTYPNAVEFEPAEIAFKNGFANIGEYIAINGFDANGKPPLINAVYDNDSNRVLNLLKAGADPNKADEDGYTALYIALQNNFLDIAVILINAPGINLNQPVATGSKPLHLAAAKGQTEIVKLLIQGSAKVNIADCPLGFDPSTEWRTPLDRAYETLKRIPNYNFERYLQEEIIATLREHGGITMRELLEATRYGSKAIAAKRAETERQEKLQKEMEKAEIRQKLQTEKEAYEKQGFAGRMTTMELSWSINKQNSNLPLTPDQKQREKELVQDKKKRALESQIKMLEVYREKTTDAEKKQKIDEKITQLQNEMSKPTD